jgi:outer membrane protein assembly factor BamB
MGVAQWASHFSTTLFEMKKILSFLLLSAFVAQAENWAQLRGPDGRGISCDKGIPVKWTAKDYAWQVKLPGKGHSSPVVWGDMVLVTSAARGGERRALQAFEAATGKEIWTEHLGGNTHPKHALNSYASATPCTDGKLVYVAWGDNDEYFMVAHDLKTGKEKWRKQLPPSLSKHGHGTATSPVLFEDLVIILNEHDTGPGYIAALDKATGKERWKIARKIEIMTYATPIIIEVKGEPVLINSCLDDGLMGINPRNGKVLWSTPGNFDLRTVAMPVHWNGIVYGSCGGGGRGTQMLAVKVGGKGNVTETHIAWKRQKSLPYVPTPIVYGDHLYMWLDNGIVICADPKTGREIWNERVGRGDFSSSPVCIDGKIYCSSRTGEFTVIKASPKYELLGRSQLGEATHATPAVSNGRMFLRGFAKLYCLEAK